MASKSILYIQKVIPIILIGILCSCENDINAVNALTSQKKIPSKTGKNVELIYSENAVIKVKMNAPLMEEYDGENGYTEMAKGIEVIFYDSLQNVTTKLTANYAVNNVSGNTMEAKNDVVVINEKGDKLNTEHLIWDQDSAKIYTHEFVKITTKDEILIGEGLEANQNFSKYKILNIKGTINIKDADNR